MNPACAEHETLLQLALERVKRLEEALRPFAEFNVLDDYRRKGYRGAIYGTHTNAGETELTIDDFDRARAALRPEGT